MESTNQYVTRREFYSISMNIILLVFFAALLSDHEGIWRLYIALWALGFILYCAYKLRSAKANSQINKGNPS